MRVSIGQSVRSGTRVFPGRSISSICFQWRDDPRRYDLGRRGSKSIDALPRSPGPGERRCVRTAGPGLRVGIRGRQAAGVGHDRGPRGRPTAEESTRRKGSGGRLERFEKWRTAGGSEGRGRAGLRRRGRGRGRVPRETTRARPGGRSQAPRRARRRTRRPRFPNPRSRGALARGAGRDGRTGVASGARGQIFGSPDAGRCAVDLPIETGRIGRRDAVTARAGRFGIRRWPRSHSAVAALCRGQCGCASHVSRRRRSNGSRGKSRSNDARICQAR